MPRTAKPKSDFGRKPGYFEKLKMGTSHPTYNPEEEGYGDAYEWASTFNVRMGFKEAQEHKAKRKWTSDWTMLGELAGVHLDENSMWHEIKAAFRAAALKTHPDRANINGMSKSEAEQKFNDASAAFTMLEDVYRISGRLPK